MKIVRIVTRMNIGGPSVHVTLLCNHLDPERFSTCLVVGEANEGEGDRLGWVAKGPAKLVRIRALRRRLHPVRDLQAFIQILRTVFSEKPHVIHTHMAKAGTLGRLAGILYNRIHPKTRAVLIHTFHGHVLDGYFPPLLSRCFAAIERWLAKRTDCLIAVSEAIRDALAARGIGKPAQWQVIRLGVDLSSLETVPFPNGCIPLRCGWVGRLVPIKNPALFLEALALSRRQNSKTLLEGRIFGDGPLRRELEAQAQQKGLSETVWFAGWRENLQDCYQDLDVVCVTSSNEGTPLALIEAMAAGRVVVSTAVGGVGDLLGVEAGSGPITAGSFRELPRGLLVRPGDAAGLAAAVSTLAKDPALRRRLAEAGRRHVQEQYSHTRLLKEISQLYEQRTGGTA